MIASLMSDAELIRRLGAHPDLRTRIESLVLAVEDETGELKTADAAEMKVIEMMRSTGHEALQSWAEHQVVLTGPELFDVMELALPPHRERLFPPTETLSMFLAQALSTDRSCQRAFNERAIKHLVSGLAPCSTHTGAYCRARQRVPTLMVSTLARHTGQWLAAHAPATWHWRGRPL